MSTDADPKPVEADVWAAFTELLPWWSPGWAAEVEAAIEAQERARFANALAGATITWGDK